MNKITKFGVSIVLATLVCGLTTATAMAGGPGSDTGEPNREGYNNVETGGTENSYMGEDGHLIVPTVIVETYSEEFEIYEQSFYTKYFYTNTSNGAITEKSVYIDVPAGIEVTMEKDGIPTPYVNKQGIYKWGSYNLQLRYFTADGTEYLGRYRFRIHPLPVKEATDVEEGTESSAIPIPPLDLEAAQADILNSLNSQPSPSPTPDEPTPEVPAMAVPDPEEPDPEDAVPGTDQRVEFLLPEVTDGVAKGSKVTIRYTNPQNLDHVTLYRDGVLVEDFSGAEIKENGSYRLEVYDVQGNSATAEFVIDYQMNAAAILSILLLVLLLVAGGIFVLRTRKEVKIS